MSDAFMSFSLVLAISSSCARVILPTLSFSGFLEPLSSLMAFLIRVVAGGVLMMKVKLLSANAVITTGSGRPGSTPWVWALNALQNSMMFRPRWPSAGPIGGDGFALPAGTCSFTKPTIFFAMFVFLAGDSALRLPGVSAHFAGVRAFAAHHQPTIRAELQKRESSLFDLRELEFDRRGTTEDRDRHADLALLVVHVLDGAVEVGERAVLDAHVLADHEFDLVAGLLGALFHLAEDLLDLVVGDGSRPVLGAADEAGHLVGVLHQVPGFVVHDHLDQHVAGVEATLGAALLAVL